MPRTDQIKESAPYVNTMIYICTICIAIAGNLEHRKHDIFYTVIRLVLVSIVNAMQYLD